MTQQSQHPVFKPKMALVAGGASIATVALLIAIKAFAYMVSGSASVLASLIDSLVDAGVSLIGFLAIRQSLKPASADFRYGHGKIEGLAALMQGAFILGAAVFLGFEAIQRLAQPHPVTATGVAIGVMLVSIVLSVLLVAVQNYSLRHAPSLAVKADRAHYSSDILMNAGVIMALLTQSYGAPVWLDSVFALGIAFWMFVTVYGIVMKAVAMLLDRELPQETRMRILEIIRSNPDVHDVHDLRTTMSGMRLDIAFDVEIDPDMTLARAHAVSKKVEDAILLEFPNAEIMIHKDPVGEIDDSRHTVKGVHH
ncbi:MAG: cation diffusion facilitator family transporter [Micavibrio aeruginosavorus]|nr:cation diffusion facilitator family transporter [Micavibrio aeruginosavorus]